MPIEKSFSFSPIKKKFKFEIDSATLRISKPGILCFGKSALHYFGLLGQGGTFIKLYGDSSKRAIAFQFFEKTALKEENGNTRYMKINKDVADATISIGTFLNALTDVGYPMKKLKVETYTDTDPYMNLGQLYYIIIPRIKSDENRN